MNNAVLIGRLTKDPELRYSPNANNTAFCRFSLAVDKDLSKEKRQEMESKNQPTADFINISTVGKLAETCGQHLAKGRLVAVQGRIQTGSYEKEGIRIFTTEILANQVQFLEWGKKEEKDKFEIDGEDIPF